MSSGPKRLQHVLWGMETTLIPHLRLNAISCITGPQSDTYCKHPSIG